MKASMVVPSYNEAAALERLILSSLHAADAFDEWVVLDHRSSDSTQAVLDRLEPLLAAYGVTLTRLFETRDLSAECTLADVRNALMRAAKNDVVAMMDADFILGHAWRDTLQNALRTLRSNKQLAAIRFKVPVVWDHLTTNAAGRTTNHGRVWVHGYRERIMRQKVVEYRQDRDGGRWEGLYYTTSARGCQDLHNDGNILISCNVKPSERIALRQTMTFFMQDAISRGKEGDWLEQYEAGELREQDPYKFVSKSITATLNLAGLNVTA